MSAEQVVMSKSAKKRAAQKARDATAAEEAAPAEPPAPSPKGKAKAEPKAQAKAEAAPKAAGKAKAAPKATATPAAEAPKAEAKNKAKAAPKATATAPAEAPKAEAKSKAKAKAKAKEEPKPKAPVEEVPDWVQIDDGTGGDWEESSGLSKKQESAKKRKAAKEEAEKAEAEATAKALKDAEIAAARANKAAVKASKNGGQSKEQELLAKVDKDIAAMKEGAAKTKAEAAAAAAKAVAEPAKPEKEPEVDDGSISVTMTIPDGKIGRIIGPKGANIAFIKEKTGIKNIDTAGGVCVILGQPEDVPKAEAAIKELIEKGYMSISFENFKADQITVPSTAIPDIIGKGGSIIQIIKKACAVEVDVEATPKGAEGGKRVVTKVKVSIAGELENVELAKKCIESIALHGYHELTHPGYSHEELAVEEWKYRFIIGKGGCEMRHIQNSFHVKVNIPRDGGEDAKVLVMGETPDVEKAVKYINKILENADQPQGRDKPEAKSDKWEKDDEGPEEAWMSAYLYKRK